MAHLPAAVRLLMQKRAAQAESGEAEPSAKRLRTDLPLPYSTPPSQPSAGQSRPPSMAAALRAAPAPRPVVVVPKATPAAAAALQMNAAALASATAAAMRPAVAPQPHRSHEEVKKALTALHCKMEKDASPRELLLQLQEVEGHVKRAEATKSLPKRHDQAIIACFKDGYTPGTEGLVKMLESGIDPDTPSTGFMSGFAPGMTPLLAAASWGKVDEARILLAAGADVRVKSPNINHTVLHMAAGGNVDGWGLEKTHNMLRLILEAEPALLTARNGMNKTAAEWAKHEKKRQSAQFLSHYATMNPGLSSR